MNDSKQIFLDYLFQIYNQANEHLKEQEHKRDQIVAFYAVLISFMITTNHVIEKNFGGPLMVVILNLFLCVIGVGVCVAIASLRGWHSQYLDSIYVINYAIAHQENYQTVKDLKNEIQRMMSQNQNKNEIEQQEITGINKVKKWFNETIQSTENSMFYGMWLFSLAPLIMIEINIYKMFNFGNKYILFAILVILFIAIAAIYFRYVKKVFEQRIENANTYKTWILDFDYYSNGQSNHDYYDIRMNDGVLSLKQNTAGVVIIPKINDKYVLIRIQRADNQWHWEFPRGFVEAEEIHGKEIDYSQAAKRELMEETNITNHDIIETIDMGEIQPDSGLIESSIHVIGIKISSLEKIKLQDSENIIDYRLISFEEMMKEIKLNQISDGFTLSAAVIESSRHQK